MSDTEQPAAAEENKPYVKEFPLREAHHLVRDLMTPNPWIYWSDFLFHITLGWAAYFTALFSPLFSLWHWADSWSPCWRCTVRRFFRARAGAFEKGTFQNFRLVWNIICGVPFMIPSFTYDGVHNDHHKPDVRHQRGWRVLAVRHAQTGGNGGLCVAVVSDPDCIGGALRAVDAGFYLIPPLRKIIWERASSLTIDPAYRRAPDAIRNDHNWQQQELGACLFGCSVIALVWSGVFPVAVLVLWYLIAVTIFILNSLRTLAAHAYRNPGDRKMTLPEQYWTRSTFREISLSRRCGRRSVALSRHASFVHEYAVSQSGKAQRRLVTQLTDNSQYIKTIRSGLWPALKQIWRESSEAAAKAPQQ
ncbi:fatty acid desaturase [candidate division WWE3 bacterium]|uniref:Fatty acid desaturase n=1 Tax=candidate division WWE3 bacterium TaxID=2053526 RepID=A0A928TR93_UNCKA|nr:fatty acid desaturase [candidate division WWE3 bacterium]